MSLNKAKKESLRLRKSGRQARVDTYQGKYAVWAKQSAVKRKSKSSQKMITLYHATSSLTLNDIVKNKYIIGDWATTTEFPSMFIKDRCCDELISVEGYPVILVAKVPESMIIWAYPENLKKNHTIGFKGMAKRLPSKYVSYVLHYKPRGKHGRNVSSKRYGSEFVRKDWAKQKLGVKEISKKMVTLYHGTTSANIPKILKNGYVLGYWTKFPTGAIMFAIGYSTGAKYKTSHPVIIEAKVPVSHITERDGWTQIYGFGEEDTASYKRWRAKRGTPDILNKSFITGMLHFKLHRPDGYNYDGNDYIDETNAGKLISGHWTKKSLKDSIKFKPTSIVKKSKLITIYHGSNSKALPEIRQRKTIQGYWTTDIGDASLYTFRFFESGQISKVGYPIVFVAKVPENQIIWDEDISFHVQGFKWKGGYVWGRDLGHGSGREKTGVLPIKMLARVYHFNKITDGYVPDMNEYQPGRYWKFIKKDWVSRKL